MESPNISARARGFTLIEVLVSLGIFTIIATFGLFISMDFYRSYSFRSERNIAVSALQKARSQALSNVNEMKHGVHYDTGSHCISYDRCYIIFEGNSFVPGAPNNLEIEASALVTINWPSDVIFNQLDGTANEVTINLSQDLNLSVITTNYEGRIDWQ